VHYAARRNNVKILEWLRGCGVDLCAVDACGASPLHFAVLGSSLVAARLLLQHGADPSLPDENKVRSFAYVVRCCVFRASSSPRRRPHQA
jgi:ankyrin repeat protein